MTFEFNFLNKLNKFLTSELPSDLRTLDQHLDHIIPLIREYGEDVGERAFWTNKRWKEVREGEQFHEAILHIFTGTNEYLIAIDGNIVNGSWSQLGTYNTLILEMAGRKELFDLKFLNNDFLILAKHGNQVREGQRKYFFLVEEGKSKHPENGSELNWQRLCEMLYNIFRDNSRSFMYYFAAFALVLFAIFLLST